MSGSIHAFDPKPSGKYIVVLTKPLDIGTHRRAALKLNELRQDQRFLGGAKRTTRVLGKMVRRGAWTLVNHANEAHAFETIEQAKRALKSKIVAYAEDRGFRAAIHAGHQIMRQVPTGYRVRVVGPELWPEPNPVEAIGAIL